MDVVAAILLALGAFCVGVLGNLLASELYDRAPSLAHRLVRIAVLRLPHADRSRYLEEWSAHIDECPGKIGKIMHATECLFGAYFIARQRVLAVRTLTRNSENEAAYDLLATGTRLKLFAWSCLMISAGLAIYLSMSGNIYYLYSDEALFRKLYNAMPSDRVLSVSEHKSLPIDPMIPKILAERVSKRTADRLKRYDSLAAQ